MIIQEELKAMKERIAELEEQAKQEGEFPQKGDKYWYINSLGVVLRDEWLDFVSERYMIEIGNVFKTEQDAHFTAEKLKVEAELRKYSRPFIFNIKNWYLVMDENKEIYPMFELYEATYGVVYFESKEKAQDAIDTIGEERIKKYLFEMED